MRAWRAAFAWIPAYAGTTTYLSPATFVAPAEAGVQAVCAHGAPLCLDLGLRRDDKVLLSVLTS